MLNKETLGKVGRTVGNILLYVFITLCILSVIITLSAKRDTDGTATLFGIQMRWVRSPSMEACDATDVSGYDVGSIRTGSMVFIDTVPEDKDEALAWYGALREGDVLTFKYVYVGQETITHRIVKIDRLQDGCIIELEGDNKSDPSGTARQVIDTRLTNSPNYVVGKVVGVNYPLGVLVSAVGSPAGLVCIIIIPSLVIIVLECARIASVLSKDRKMREREEREAKESELEELRRRLSELEAERAKGGSEKDSSSIDK